MSGFGTRYLNHKDFLRLCKDLEINNFHSDMDERWLELLEREKVLFPVCRVLHPVNYLKLLNDVHYNPENPHFHKFTFSLPKRYGSIHSLKSNINGFWLGKFLFHVLDKQKLKQNKFVQIPIEQKFHKWKNYKKYVGNRFATENYESTAEHYYSYWQAYHFYEVTKACTLNYIINVFDDKIHSELWQRRIPSKKIYSGSLPLKHDNIKGDFWCQGKYFETLSFYVQTLKKYDFLILRLKDYKRDRFGYLDEESSKRYLKKRKCLAKFIIKKFDFTIPQSFDFLKFLVGRYEQYKDQRKEKLVQFITDDIYYLILLMQDGFDLEYDFINKELGRVIHNFGNTLDVIFPQIFSKERENVLYTLDSFLSSDLNFNKYENVSRKEIQEFLNFIDSKNLQLFYHSLGQINLTQLKGQTIYLHIFYLSLLLENAIKLISSTSASPVLFERFKVFQTLKPSIKNYFKDEEWIKILFDKKSKLWENYTKVNISTNINERVKVEIDSINIKGSKDSNQIVKMFLVCGFARNLSAHEHSKVYAINRETYSILVNNIVSAIWFTWKYAIKNGYINIGN